MLRVGTREKKYGKCTATSAHLTVHPHLASLRLVHTRPHRFNSPASVFVPATPGRARCGTSTGTASHSLDGEDNRCSTSPAAKATAARSGRPRIRHSRRDISPMPSPTGARPMPGRTQPETGRISFPNCRFEAASFEPAWFPFQPSTHHRAPNPR